MPRRGQQLDECARATATHARQFCQCAAERQQCSVRMGLLLVGVERFLSSF